MNRLEFDNQIFNKMIAFIPRFSGYRRNNDFKNQKNHNSTYGRDSISFYFEQCEDNSEGKRFNVYRFYYNYQEYKKFITNDLNASTEKLNIKASPFEITEKQLHDLIEFLNSDNDYKTKMIVKEMDIQNYFDIETDELLENLNLAFCKYYFDCFESTFNFDETSNDIDFLYNKCFGNDSNNDDNYETSKYIEDIDGSDDYALRVYDVGQGNCSALIKYKNKDKKDYEVVMVFDFGLQPKIKNSDLDGMIAKINNQTIILISHFDMDHINNIINRTNLMPRLWIFPKYHGTGVKANKFFAVLLKVASHKTFSGIVPRYGGYLDLSDNIKIYQTIGKMDPNQSTKANAECLVTTIKSGKNNVLIPADSLYQEFDSRILETHYDYVLIPHHCCKYDTSLIRDIPKINSVIDENTKGIVLSGRNSFGHANYNHLLRYNKRIIFYHCNIYDDHKNIINKTSISTSLGKKCKFFEIKL